MPSPKQPHPLLWLAEPLRDNPSYLDRAMFGGRAVHFGGRLVLYLTVKEEPWRGVLVPTERAHQASLLIEFPTLAPHPVLPKWLYLPETTPSFETDAQRLVSLIRALDPRIGVLPGVKAKQKAGTRTRGGKLREDHLPAGIAARVDPAQLYLTRMRDRSNATRPDAD